MSIVLRSRVRLLQSIFRPSMVHRREGSGAASCNGLLVVAGHWVLVLGVFRYFSQGLINMCTAVLRVVYMFR